MCDTVYTFDAKSTTSKKTQIFRCKKLVMFKKFIDLNKKKIEILCIDFDLTVAMLSIHRIGVEQNLHFISKFSIQNFQKFKCIFLQILSLRANLF